MVVGWIGDRDLWDRLGTGGFVLEEGGGSEP